jgi:hypothetical protein
MANLSSDTGAWALAGALSAPLGMDERVPVAGAAFLVERDGSRPTCPTRG